MESINDAVARNVKELRQQRRLSLDTLAGLTGVSKSMPAQIERGEANPTVSTVWKIANGLKVPFSQLTTKSERDFEIIPRDKLLMLTEDEGRYRNYPVFPYDETRKFEVYIIELDPGAFMEAQAHPAGTQEYIILFEGEMEVSVNGQCLKLGNNCALRFKADRPHAYTNTGAGICRMHMIMDYSAT